MIFSCNVTGLVLLGVILVLFIVTVCVMSKTKSVMISLIVAGILVAVVMGLYLCKKRHDPNNEIQRIENLGTYDMSKRPMVVVSFSTIPSRTQYIPMVIQKLRKQSFQPDKIYVNVPYYSKRLNKEYVLGDIDLSPDVEIVRCEDYGPATKLLGCISKIGDPNTAIITIDDDQDYHEDTLKLLVAYSIKYPDNVLAFRTLGLDLDGSTPCPSTKNIKTPDAYYAEGFAGVLYKRRFISDEMIDYFKNISPECFVSDDLVLSTWMDIQGYDRIKLCDFINTSTDKVIDANDALHRDKRKKVYNKCSQEMRVLAYRSESLKLLKIFDTVMRKNNIRYMVFFGTLLGIVRDGNFIDTDHDVDVIIFEEDLDRYLQLQLQFENMDAKMKYVDNIHRLYTSHDYNSYMDVFVYRKDGDRYIDINRQNRKRWPSYKFLHDDLFPLKEYSISGLVVTGPNNAVNILEQLYGDWKTPRSHDKYVGK